MLSYSNAKHLDALECSVSRLSSSIPGGSISLKQKRKQFCHQEIIFKIDYLCYYFADRNLSNQAITSSGNQASTTSGKEFLSCHRHVTCPQPFLCACSTGSRLSYFILRTELGLITDCRGNSEILRLPAGFGAAGVTQKSALSTRQTQWPRIKQTINILLNHSLLHCVILGFPTSKPPASSVTRKQVL